MFIRLSEAYQILSDLATRASYDAAHRDAKRLRGKNFRQASVSTTSEWEKRRSLEVVTATYLGIMSPESTVCWEG